MKVSQLGHRSYLIIFELKKNLKKKIIRFIILVFQAHSIDPKDFGKIVKLLLLKSLTRSMRIFNIFFIPFENNKIVLLI